MSTNYYFHSLAIHNFRLFRDLKISNFKRINIIGGFNGSGKTALLETLFFLVDLRNPVCLVRPFGWRQIPISGREGLDYFFQHDGEAATIKFSTKDGNHTISIERSLLPPNAISALSAKTLPTGGVGGSNSFVEGGIKISSGSGANAFESYLIPHGEGYAGTISKLGTANLPVCQLLSSNLRVSPVELAEWLSDCIKANQLGVAIEFLRILDPSLTGLFILYNGSNPTIYANRASGRIPVDLLGDGFRNLLTTILTIFRLRHGVVLLDEVDTALHYSITDKYWEIVARAAHEAECQIFATSHSREAILSASTGVDRAGRKADFRYLRLERSGEGHQAILYDHNDLSIASEHGFEFR